MTYTITQETSGNADVRLELPEPLYLVSRYGGVNEIWCDIMLKDDNYLEGIYEWKNEIDDEYIDVITGIQVDEETKHVTSTNRQLYTHQSLINFIHKDLKNYIRNPIPESIEGLCYRVKSTGDIWLIKHSSSCYPVIDITTGNVYISVSVSGNMGYKYKMNLEDGTVSDYTEMPLDDVNITGAYGFPNTCQLLGNFNDIEILGDIFYHLSSDDSTIFGGYASWYFVTNDGQGNLVYDKDNPYVAGWNDDSGAYIKGMTYGYVSFITWHHIKTEFTLEHPYQLLPGVTAIGMHGIVEGDDSIYDHIDLSEPINKKIQLSQVFTFDNFTNKGITQKEHITNINDISNVLYKKNEFNPGLTRGYYWVDINFPYFFCYDFSNCDQNSFKMRIYNGVTGLLIGQEQLFNYNHNYCSFKVNHETSECYLISRDFTNSKIIVNKYDINDLSIIKSTYEIPATAWYHSIRILNNKLYILMRPNNDEYIIYEDGISTTITYSGSIKESCLLYADDNYYYIVNKNDILIYNRTNSTLNTITAVGEIFANSYINVEPDDNDGFFTSPNHKVYQCIDGSVNFVVKLGTETGVDYVDDGIAQNRRFQHFILNNVDYYLRRSSDGYNVIYDNTGTELSRYGIINQMANNKYSFDYNTGDATNFIVYVANILDNIVIADSNDTNNKLLKLSNDGYNGLKPYMVINNNPFQFNLTPEQEQQAEGITDNILYGLTELENENQGGE